jgi:hypothetical protein
MTLGSLAVSLGSDPVGRPPASTVPYTAAALAAITCATAPARSRPGRAGRRVRPGLPPDRLRSPGRTQRRGGRRAARTRPPRADRSDQCGGRQRTARPPRVNSPITPTRRFCDVRNAYGAIPAQHGVAGAGPRPARRARRTGMTRPPGDQALARCWASLILWRRSLPVGRRAGRSHGDGGRPADPRRLARRAACAMPRTMPVLCSGEQRHSRNTRTPPPRSAPTAAMPWQVGRRQRSRVAAVAFWIRVRL